MTQNGNPTPRRGPLKYSVETPAPQLEAGRKLSINLLINNPYDVPVTIVSTETVLPAHFEDPDNPTSFWGGVLHTASSQKPGLDSEKLQVVSGKSLVKPQKSDDGYTSDGQITLQPGNTVVRAFTIRTKQSLIFTPSVHSLNIQVHYKMESDKDNFDAVKFQLNIRSQFKSLILGSTLGVIVGTLLRYTAPLDKYWPPGELIYNASSFLIAVATGVLAGSVLVIAFASKKRCPAFYHRRRLLGRLLRRVYRWIRGRICPQKRSFRSQL